MTPLLPFDAEPFREGGLLVEPEQARSILRPQRDDRYGFGFSLSPYRGCAHGCRYCYVREYPHPLHPASQWGGWSAPKLNAPELLWAQRHRMAVRGPRRRDAGDHRREWGRRKGRVEIPRALRSRIGREGPELAVDRGLAIVEQYQGLLVVAAGGEVAQRQEYRSSART